MPGGSLVSAANQAAFNIANAVGAALGALVISQGLGYTAPMWVGAVLALAGAAIAVLARAVDRRPAADVAASSPSLPARSSRPTPPDRYYGPYTRQRAHPRGAAPLPRRPAPRHQGRRAPRRRTRPGLPALSRDELIGAVHDNLDHLGVDVLDVVNLRVGGRRAHRRRARSPSRSSALAELREQGLIRHLGVSNVSTRSARRGAVHRARVVSVQNLYNLAHRAGRRAGRPLRARGHRLRPVLPVSAPSGSGPPQTAPSTVITPAVANSTP